jgi:hypothetical protein
VVLGWCVGWDACREQQPCPHSYTPQVWGAAGTGRAHIPKDGVHIHVCIYTSMVCIHTTCCCASLLWLLPILGVVGYSTLTACCTDCRQPLHSTQQGVGGVYPHRAWGVWVLGRAHIP